MNITSRTIKRHARLLHRFTAGLLHCSPEVQDGALSLLSVVADPTNEDAHRDEAARTIALAIDPPEVALANLKQELIRLSNHVWDGTVTREDIILVLRGLAR